MKNKSFYTKQKFKTELINFADKIDEMYYQLEDELYKDKENNDIENKREAQESNRLFDKITQLTDDEKQKIIKSYMPLRLRLFNKIYGIGYCVKEHGGMEFRTRLGEGYFYIDLTNDEIKRWLNKLRKE